MEQMISNPVLKGFNPDPCICRDGEDYYIATSTFQWFPGVQIFHSRNMADWKLICRPLDHERLLDLIGVPDSGGVWAPCLSYHDGFFYLVYSIVRSFTNYYKDVDNYVTTAETIKGPWSEPVYLNSSGIDPSLFHDENGRKYLLNQLFNHRDKENQFIGIVIQEYDDENKCLIGVPRNIFKGSDLGITEGPHLYKIENYYYLLCAEGGTFYEHAVTVARSKNLYGPYELSPYNPLLTSYGHEELKLQKSGHGSLVHTLEGEWYLAHLCARPNGNHGRCMLGRETAIQKLIRTPDGWFRLANGRNTPDAEVTALFYKQSENIRTEDTTPLQWKLPMEFQTLRQPPEEHWIRFDEETGYLELSGKESMESMHRQSLIGRRREDFTFTAQTCIEFRPVTYQQMAGLALYYDTTNYIYLHKTWDEENGEILCLLECDRGRQKVVDRRILTEKEGRVHLRMVVENDLARFYYSIDGEVFLPIGSAMDATHMSDDYYDARETGLRFTGTFIALCAQDISGQRIPSRFLYFSYKPGLLTENGNVL